MLLCCFSAHEWAARGSSDWEINTQAAVTPEKSHNLRIPLFHAVVRMIKRIFYGEDELGENVLNITHGREREGDKGQKRKHFVP